MQETEAGRGLGEWSRNWTGTVGRRIFPPRCARADCVPRSFIWRRTPMIQMDGRWLCSARCVEAEARATFEHMSIPKEPFAGHRVPLGLLMLARGFLSEEQLQAVLAAQRQAGHGKIGSWAQRLNFATERQVLTALSLQWSCPVLALQTPPDFHCMEMIPWRLLQSLRMMPVRFIRSTRLLYMALCEGIDHGALLAIEQLLRCHVVPCLVSDHAMDGWIDRKSSWTAPGVQVFNQTSGAAEMARITASYAGRLCAHQIQIVRCGHYGWVRLTAGAKDSDLLFDLGCLHHDRLTEGMEWSAVG